MVTQSKQWQKAMEPWCVKFKFAAIYGVSVRGSREDWWALSGLMAQAARHLDSNHDYMLKLAVEFRELQDTNTRLNDEVERLRSEVVTLVGNV